MRTFQVNFLGMDKTVSVNEGTTLLETQIIAGFHPDAPCNGQGTCGKCLINIVEADGTKRTEKACQVFLSQDMVVELPEETEFHILEAGTKRQYSIKPAINRETIEKENALGVAIDIGTTSVVCYLVDLMTGKELSHSSMLNPQSQYGADVISRCEYAINNGLDKLSGVIRDALNQLIKEACDIAGAEMNRVFVVTVVGNTCMHHLFLGIDPQPLTVVPYEAKVKDEMVVKPAEVDLNINQNGIVQVLPNIAGFVGADTVGCLLATEFDEIEEMSLMIDIGTNGEMVMGNKTRMVACSTAAGPAFEGAKIECGMRGKDGAIDHVELNGDLIECHVIDDVKAEGICGSGLMDAVAVLLDAGIIDETGKIIDSEKTDLSQVCDTIKANINRVENREGSGKVFLLKDGIYISQKDIREVQLAKGAIAAGIELMAEKLGIAVPDIKKIMIAGAFGNYMDPHSACRIGLLPAVLEDRIEMIGNAAGEGSRIATLNLDEFHRAQVMKENIEFLELASSPVFQDTFVDNLLFE